MNVGYHLIVTLLVLPAFSPTLVSAENALEVKFPFATETARTNFSKCFPDVSKNDLSKMANISKYGYKEFSEPLACPPGVSDCKPGIHFFRSTRFIEFVAPNLRPSKFRSILLGNEGGNCSYDRFKNISTTVSRNTIIHRFSPFHQERKCVRGAKFDVWDTSADVTLTVVLNNDFSLSSSHSVGNAKQKFFGVFNSSHLGGLVSPILMGFASTVSVPVMLNMLSTPSGLNFGTDSNFAKTGINLHAYSNLQKKLDALGHRPVTDYQTIRERSGFFQEGDEVSIEVIQAAYALELIRKDFINVRKIEIDFLSSLNEVAPKEYTVAPGDNLWKIVKAHYLDPRLYPVVAELAGLRNLQRLVPGQTLSLPRWQQLCEKLGGNPEAVLPRESLWLKASRGQIPRDLRRVKTLSGRPSLIYPLEVLRVEDGNDKR
ncbi:LysM peptidoglycan-binding domain-containing protein [Noviherbaspirillum sedimenti]|uniref:LysM peptidoglycan-binding domain-containing protein n=1 Tax=Noviherbaspirillum sedimenti TaxID=2320865 RepID=UPI0011C43346|nr:LysM peptidoglycan-binding domain-containing protein [Noviherbaspirillum sedimenti]